MFRPIIAIAALIALCTAAPVFAQEPVGCDQFKWPLNHEKSLLATPAKMASGSEWYGPLDKAVTLTLAQQADAKLPMTPSRASNFVPSYAGFLRLSGLARGGLYRVTLSRPAWIDIVQNGQELKVKAFTGARGCAGVAKSVKFMLAPAPFVVEISGAHVDTVAFVITAD